ncbi:helix-turn-helix domain-containing protein [uncultured Microbacterium sp.]|uniref:helix-turn-helix domain-containing protein n=1 Tax=uncultured Microbacterium sp. TaxID=191216 RepID=UPI0028D38D45|nr:helix-turn-helix domain-containing protein [uncultured Microbacterium sp.]
MRYIDGQEYATVGEVAEAAGVSAQTIRLWEKAGRVPSRRTPGGHRLFDAAAVKAAVDHAVTKRRLAHVRPVVVQAKVNEIGNGEIAATGARIRSAREQSRRSQEEVAGRAGISRSLLSAIERGESGVSVQVFNRIAEALSLSMSDLAPVRDDQRIVMRSADRPKTVLDGGVTWEELASSGHLLAPAMLTVPPGGASGGVVTFSRENFVCVLEGELTFELVSQAEVFVLGVDDSIVLTSGQAHSWRNSGTDAARAIWVERLGS